MQVAEEEQAVTKVFLKVKEMLTTTIIMAMMIRINNKTRLQVSKEAMPMVNSPVNALFVLSRQNQNTTWTSTKTN